MNASSDDEMFFADEEKADTSIHSKNASNDQNPWKIILIDDDQAIHDSTLLILKGFSFNNRNLQIFSAYSAKEAQTLLVANPDMAVALLDVVMESDDAGLTLVHFIRKEIPNPLIRIILRTGQPGQAPEHTVVVDYDINDYMNKATLSKQRLLTSITASLRSYRDLLALETTRAGLKQIIGATGTFFKPTSLSLLASGVLAQLSTLFCLENQDILSTLSSLAFIQKKGNLVVYAGSGDYENDAGKPLKQVLSSECLIKIQERLPQRASCFFDNAYLACFKADNGIETFLYIEGVRPLSTVGKDLVQVFSANIAMAFNTLFLNREIINTQKDVTFTLGEVIEVRSKEAGNHVRRVAECSRVLAVRYGLSIQEVDELTSASPLHDLGKIAIPDHILNKPGKLDADEWQIMMTHTTLGFSVLDKSDRSILKTGAIIALQHHEKWDGTGYPNQLKGDQIHIAGRITAVADVFDALFHDRCYKKAWPLERILTLFREERGKHFDPTLVDLFFETLDDILEIHSAFEG